jgi:murein DD-endopeptidase MepM/ murein hydrolase activator NlpD
MSGLDTRRAVALDHDAGGIALLSVLAATAFLGLGLVVVVTVVDAASALARARTAADAAALAAAGASPLAGGDGDAHRAASRLARANGARLVACCEPGGDGASRLHAEVEVTVALRTVLARGVADALAARAAASLRPTGEHIQLPAPTEGSEIAPPDGSGALHRPARGPLTSGFGYRTHPITGVRRLHAGVDIGAPTGTPIVAAADGRVTFAGWRGGYGKTVLIDHGNLVTLYAHQSAVGVRAGQTVRRGETIGRVGSTGQSTGPHLHFEVRVNGRPRDPLPYLR